MFGNITYGKKTHFFFSSLLWSCWWTKSKYFVTFTFSRSRISAWCLELPICCLYPCRDHICESNDAAEDLSAFISSIPCGLSADDVEDLCSLAQYYAVKTPHSFWNVRFGRRLKPFVIVRTLQVTSYFLSLQEFRYIFNRNIRFPDESALPVELNLSQALCMPLTVQELLNSTMFPRHVGGSSERPRFFVVDCRPADQYNAGHLPTAFHLDADLVKLFYCSIQIEPFFYNFCFVLYLKMLQEKNAFALASQGLLTAQKQALEANSIAGGEHLCFVGSGREKEDQYVHMVVANFLHKHCAFVSMLVGGYEGTILSWFSDRN